MRTFLTALAATVAAAVIVAATVVAGHKATTSYTGCLNVASGTISKIALGNAPQSACGESQLEIHLGSGDVTGITAGTGLEGGGDEGAVSVRISDSYQLPQTCADGQVTKWTGTSWACGDDNNTAYSGANFATSNQDCAASQFANGINSSGALKCGVPAKGSLSRVVVSGPAGTMCSALDPSEGCSKFGSSHAICPAGSVVSGGGFVIGGFGAEETVVHDSIPSSTSNNWFVFAENTSATNGSSITAYAVCLSLT